MRCWVVLWWIVGSFVALFAAAGCEPESYGAAWCGSADETCAAASGDLDDDPIATPEGRECACIETAPDGFTGPSWYWLGPPAEMPHCPETAPFDGVSAYANPSPAIEPPCPATQSVQWGLVARECKITTHDLCDGNGLTCAPVPPAGYSLCVYQDDDALCELPYPTAHSFLRWDSGQECSGMGVQWITLCCAEEDLGH